MVYFQLVNYLNICFKFKDIHVKFYEKKLHDLTHSASVGTTKTAIVPTIFWFLRKVCRPYIQKMTQSFLFSASIMPCLKFIKEVTFFTSLFLSLQCTLQAPQSKFYQSSISPNSQIMYFSRKKKETPVIASMLRLVTLQRVRLESKSMVMIFGEV